MYLSSHGAYGYGAMATPARPRTRHKRRSRCGCEERGRQQPDAAADDDGASQKRKGEGRRGARARAKTWQITDKATLERRRRAEQALGRAQRNAGSEAKALARQGQEQRLQSTRALAPRGPTPPAGGEQGVGAARPGPAAGAPDERLLAGIDPLAAPRQFASPSTLTTAKTLLGAYFTGVHRARLLHAERVPPGPVVFVSNHWSDADGFLLCGMLPRPLEQLTVVANGRIARGSPPTLWMMKQIGAVLTAEDRDERRGHAVAQAVAALREGRSVIIFPQGALFASDARRTPAHTGFAVIAAAAGVPVVPIMLYGTHEAWPAKASLPRPGVPVVACVGDAVSPSDIPRVLPGEGEASAAAAKLRSFAAATMARVFAMQPEAEEQFWKLRGGRRATK